MAWMDDFSDEMKTNVKISALGALTGFDDGGQPQYGTGSTRYDALAAVWMLSASEILANDKINCPSTHMIALDPAKVTGTLISSDTCEITINGILEQFKIYTPENVMGMNDIMQITALKKVTS